MYWRTATLVLAVAFGLLLVAEASDSNCADGSGVTNNATHICFCHDTRWTCIEKGNECKKGDVKQDDCNTCSCGDIGFWACTKMLCPPVDPDAPQARTLSTIVDYSNETHFCVGEQNSMTCYEKECNPGQRTMKDCNACVCSQNGLYACTRMGCDHVTFSGGESHVAKRSIEEAANVCEPRDQDSLSSQYCECYENEWHCHERVCTEGETRMQECNRCWCSQGLWMCTLMGCITAERYPLGPTSAPNTADHQVAKRSPCEEGAFRMDDCNYCSCFDGDWGCTLKACPPHDRPHPRRLGAVSDSAAAAPGMVEEYVCHTFDINTNSTHFCLCQDNQWNCFEKDCKDGETKTDECGNRCWCSRGVWACTLMGCIDHSEQPAPHHIEERSADVYAYSQSGVRKSAQ